MVWTGATDLPESGAHLRRRICVVTTSYPSSEGDPSGHFVRAEVRELEAAGHDVEVIAPRAGGAFGWPGVAARLRERPWRALDAGGFLGRATVQLARKRPSKIVAHWALPCGFPVALAGGHADAELEVVSHGADVRLLGALPDRLRALAVDALTSRAAVWRFVSTSLLENLLARVTPREASRIEAIATVAPSPLTMVDVTRDVRVRREALGARRLYVTAGRLVPTKRVDKVIDYVATRDRPDDATLVVLGDGPERRHLAEVARRWRLDARFLGTTPRHEALAWIGAADEFVHASVAEGHSTVLREAAHLGVPVTVLA